MEQWLVERADISARLSLRRGVRRRTTARGEIWLDHHCLFHEDTHRSASWAEEGGTYYCRTEDKTYPVPRVLEALNMHQRELKSRIKNVRALPDLLPDLIYTYVFPDGTAATHLRSWTSNFTADVAGTVMADQTLPSGNWNISGTASWTQGGNTYSINLTTTVALHYNASCTATPRFDAGTLTAAVTKGTQSGTVTIKFLTCGSVSATTA